MNASRIIIHILTKGIFVASILFVFAAMPSTAIARTSPKLANYYLKYDISDAEATSLARWDLLILDMEVQVKSLEQLKMIRKLNPNIKILAYVTAQEIFTDAPNGYSELRRSLSRGIQESWYIKNSAGQRISWWPGTFMLDVTNQSGWPTHLRDFMITQVLSTGLWDGVFYDNAWDNLTYFVGTDVDLNNDRRPDARTAVDTAWKAGMTFLYESTQEKTNGRYLVVGNGTTQVYLGSLNGQMIENFVGGSAWGPTMQAYRAFARNHRAPRINIINANTGNRGTQEQYQLMRFGLTSSLLEDTGYYSFDFGDTAHNQLWWYDEYGIDLGNAVGTAVSQRNLATYGPDVWKRNFDRGISLVNSDAVARTVDLGGDFEALRGVQDPAANNGAIVRSLTLPPQDGRILLKTTDTLEDVIFTNGDFVRFFRGDGSRVRNGYFVFDDTRRGGTQIGRIDMDGNGIPEIILVTGSRIEIYRDNGELYMRAHPYTANYRGEIRIAVGDLDNNGFSELFVAPGPGSALPIKVYARHGTQIKRDWYPFGEGYSGGYSLAVGALSGPFRSNLVIGAGVGSKPYVNIYDWQYNKTGEWFAYETTFTGGVFVATGDLDGDGVDEIITGPGPGKGPIIRTFKADGTRLSEFSAYTTFLTEGIQVRTADVDFDGKDDIIGMSSGI
jgi:hypothetical protein